MEYAAGAKGADGGIVRALQENLYQWKQKQNKETIHVPKSNS